MAAETAVGLAVVMAVEGMMGSLEANLAVAAELVGLAEALSAALAVVRVLEAPLVGMAAAAPVGMRTALRRLSDESAIE